MHALADNQSKIEQWVERINQRDLAAMTATVKRVQTVVGDDKSSVHSLTEVLESEPLLASKILSVANSPSYLTTPDPVTSVARAATVMGFDPIRNICITNRMLDSLMDNRNIPPSILDRVLKRTAASLHAAVQARALMAGAEVYVREDVFLAALFDQIGEGAFWSLGGDEAEALDRLLRKGDVERDAHIVRFVGGSFRELGAALMESWGLSEIGDAEDHVAPSGLTATGAVRLGNEIADCVANEGWYSPRLLHLNPRIAEKLGVDEADADRLVRNAGREAEEIAHCYGVAQLARRMSYRPNSETAATTAGVAASPTSAPRRFRDSPATTTAAHTSKPKPPAPGTANFSIQQTVLNEMKAMLATNPDINAMIQTAMGGVQRGIGMDRTVTGLLSEDRRQVRTRFFLGEDGERWSKQFRFDVPFTKSLMRECINDNQTFRYNAQAPGTVAKLVPVELMRFCGGKDFVIAPILIGARSIGVLYADRFYCDNPIKQDDFDAFVNFTQQLGICLNAITQRKF